MKTYAPQVTRRKLHSLCRELQGAESLSTTVESIRRFAGRRRRRSSWYRYFRKLADSLESGVDGFAVFVKGNSKLPFWSFSTLPQYTCPGAGSCLKYCYSFTAWRYPAAVCRQIQNTLLLRFNPKQIADAFQALPKGAIVRLYVDGDVDSMLTLAFWFNLLFSRDDIQAYGYSKSFEVFREWDKQALLWPRNYVLNFSNGSRYDGLPIVDEVAQLPITRGRFLAVPVKGWDIGFRRYESKDYHNDVRTAAREATAQAKVFSCPGHCGACLPSGEHACGTMKLHGIVIANGSH